MIYRRRQLLAAGGFDETMGAFGDGLMVRRLALEFRVLFRSGVGRRLGDLSGKPLGPLRAVGGRKHQTDWPVRWRRSRPAFPQIFATPMPTDLAAACVSTWRGCGSCSTNRRSIRRGLTEVLQFAGAAQRGLEIAARLPFARFAVLAWAALVLRPYAIGAVLAGYWRATKAKWFELPRLRKVFAALHRPPSAGGARA